MLELFSAGTSIVVGLELHNDEGSLLQTAGSLAQRTGARLVFVHAAPPFRSYALAGEGFALPYEDYEREAYESDAKSLREQMRLLRETLPEDVLIETEVVRDYAEDALEAVALECHAQLIMCGYRVDAPQSVWEGLSTPLSLMAHSSLPVMALPLGRSIDFCKKPLNLLVADSLHEDSHQTLQAALSFAKSIDTASFHHLHVNDLTQSDIVRMIEHLKMAMLEGKLPSDPELTPDLYLERLHGKLLSLLKQRIYQADPEFSQGLRYRPEIRFGQTAEEIHRAMIEHRADVMFYGKHHFLRRKTWMLGKMPYKAMVDRHVATIVVPEGNRG